MAEKIYHGSCECGKVLFEVKLDLDQGTFKCNCSICTKARFWGAAIKNEAFNLVSGEDDLTIYFGTNVKHFFCKHCGIKMFGRVSMPQGPMVSISLATLDDLDTRELSRAPVQYMDGRHDQWDRVPEFKDHL
ncbi:MAG: GFA family protein [Nitrospiria bacterium]